MSQERRIPARAVLDIGPRRRAKVALRKSATLLRRNPGLSFGLGLLAFMVLVTLLAPVIATHDPRELNLEDLQQGPSTRHYFGADFLGRDLFSRTVYGGRFSLMVGFSVATLASVMAIVVGLISGWYPLADKIIMRVVDGLLAIPSFLLAIAVIVAFGATVQNVILILALGSVPSASRITRVSVLTLKNQMFVEAARAVGVPTWRILARHIVPNMVAPIIVYASFLTAGAILAEAGLSFLGVGVDLGTPTWGNIMSGGRDDMTRNPWIMFWPGMAITVTVLAFSIAGDALRDILDPRLRGTGLA